MISHIQTAETILYVQDQEISARFYESLFRQEPDLHVPGMTEFIVSDTFKLGLMPNRGISKILKDKMPPPDEGIGIPRCELYLYVDDIQFEFNHAMKMDIHLIIPILDRDWGDKVCYFSDPDGHIIAFAEKIKK